MNEANTATYATAAAARTQAPDPVRPIPPPPMPHDRERGVPERDDPEEPDRRKPPKAPPLRDRPTVRLLWVEGPDGEPEPARWDAEGQFWVLLGTENGMADDPVTVLGPVQGPPGRQR